MFELSSVVDRFIGITLHSEMVSSYGVKPYVRVLDLAGEFSESRAV